MARTIEERKNIRRAAFFGILTVGAIILFLYVGLPLVARLSTFISGFRNDGEVIDINDKTPPAPPRFDSFDNVTNEVSIRISGKTEEAAVVYITLNGKEEEILADADGEFSVSFALRKGENSFSAYVKDTAGNESQRTQTYTITQDSEPPELSIISPNDADSFFGSQERQITIEGQTEEGAFVTINERVVVVEQDGSFEFFTSLSEGANTFAVVAEDEAGNKEETSLTLNFSP